MRAPRPICHTAPAIRLGQTRSASTPNPHGVILEPMRPKILIPLLLVVLSCITPAARAGESCDAHSPHIHAHGHSAHLHTPTHAHARHDHDETHQQMCSDDTHEDCCAHHHHDQELTLNALPLRSPELQPATAPIVSSIPEFALHPVCATTHRWAPLHQRPPDHLHPMRTCVMLN